jgi:alkylation response protein AidB-like acyl-CoA dehydrogenase
MSSTQQFDRVAAPLREEFARIAPGAVERERNRALPRAEVSALAAAGFGALRVPQSAGGAGLSLPQAATLWREAAAADSNITQIFRGQFAFVEDRLHTTDASRDGWFERFAAGQFVGNAWSETGSTTTAGVLTTLTRTSAGLRLSGRKYYTTGSIYAQWTDATATAEDGSTVAVIVPTDAPGVTISDDWDGFGQRLTGTGTIVFDDVPVDPENVIVLTDRFSYQTALYQLVLLTVQAGIARRAAQDAAQAVRDRTRVYTHGLASLARHDGQVLAVIGQVESTAFAAEAIADRAAHALQAVSDVEHQRGSEAHAAALAEAELATARGQVVLTELVPQAVGTLFNALGASGTSQTQALDRHWRNARTVGSHNPVIYKQRIVGDHAVNGTDPIRLWDVGIAAGDPSTTEGASEREAVRA